VSDLSRRSLLAFGTASVVPLLAPANYFAAMDLGSLNANDMRLVALHAQFRLFASTIDRIVEGRPNPPSSEKFWASFERLISSVEKKQATSIAGLRIKAQLAKWSLMDDVNLCPEATIDMRMGRSIIRDLVSNLE
jgi:hypothetical protein